MQAKTLKVGDKVLLRYGEKLFAKHGFEESTIIKVYGFGKYDLRSRLGFVLTGVEAEYLEPLPPKGPA